jgi:hypothetical protein
MAVTRTTYSSLLGFDPVEEERNRQKLWTSLYSGASSPWEKVGIGIGQLAGGLFGGESTAATQQEQLNKVSNDALQQFAPNSADYFRYISENLPDSMSMVKTNAAAMARDAETKERTAMQADTKYVKENPEALAIELQPLTTRLENRAKLLYAKEGYDPASGEPIPESIMKRLEATPEYKKIAQLSQVGQTALMDKAQKEEKEAIDLQLAKKNLEMKDLDFTKKNLDIKKVQQDLAGASQDVLSSRAVFQVNGLDYLKPLNEQKIPNQLKFTPGFMSSLIQAQRKALEGVDQATINAALGDKAPAAPAAAPKKETPKADAVKVTPQDEEALNWLRSNPNDPRAGAVRNALKAKGLVK